MVDSTVYHLKEENSGEITTAILPIPLREGDLRGIHSAQVVRGLKLEGFVPPYHSAYTFIVTTKNLGKVAVEPGNIKATCYEYRPAKASDLPRNLFKAKK